MPLWNRVKQELDRAGKAAQGALDEGKVRLEAFRTRQLADKAAQALGYALYRARTAGGELDAESYERLRATLATHEAEALRHEALLADMAKTHRPRTGTPDSAAGPAADSAPAGGVGGASTQPPPPSGAV